MEMQALVTQYKKKHQTKKRNFISTDDHEINYFREEKAVPKMIVLKGIQSKLIVEYNHEFKGRQALIERLHAKEIYEAKKEKMR